MTRLALTCIGTLLLAALGAPAQDSLRIVSRGEAQAVIVVPDDAPDQVKEAAQTLAAYIKRATGAELEIAPAPAEDDPRVRLHVGESAYVQQHAKGLAELDDDGFVIQPVDATNVVICGPTPYGTEFGVYEFLERYVGVRWLLPGEHGDDVPQVEGLEISGETVRDEPAFFSRLFSGLRGAPQLKWARFNRMRGRVSFHHNLLRLLPPETYTEAHPEWFPMQNGERFLPATNDTHRWQPCFTAPGLVEEAVKNITQYFRDNPDVPSYSLGTNDSSGYCQCEQCVARISGEKNFLGRTDYSDLYYDWANQVIEGVLKEFPDKWFGCLAYSEVAEPPKRVKVHPRLIPYMTYDRMKWVQPEVRADGHRITEGWEAVSPTLGWYDYIYGTPYCLPRVWFHHMGEYYRYGHAHGVRALYAEAYPNWGEGPKLYVSLKLQWDPTRDVDELLDDWYRRCVGPEAAPHLAEYYALWERFWTEKIPDSAWFTAGGQYLSFGTPGYLADADEADIARSRELLEMAVGKAQTEPQKERGKLLLRAFEYYEASALAYQADQKAVGQPMDTEEQALAALDRSEAGLRMAEKRQRLALEEFPKDPVLVNPLGIERFGALLGSSWGAGGMWTTMDWVKRGDNAVRRRVRELAEQSPAARVRSAAAMMLGMAEGTLEPVSANPSYEDGEGAETEGWWYWVKFGVGKMQRSEAQAHSGQWSIHCDGMKRGGPVHSVTPIEPGRYGALCYVFVPEGVEAKGTVELAVTPRGGDDQNLPGFSTQIVPKPGQWVLIATAGDIKPQINDKDVTHVMLIPTVNGWEGSEVFIDDVGLYRLEDLEE